MTRRIDWSRWADNGDVVGKDLLDAFDAGRALAGDLTPRNLPGERSMTDYTKLNGPDMLQECGMDAKKWAEAFCQINPDANVDEGLMIGWFANAIMHTLDTERGTIHNGDHLQYLIDKARGTDADATQ